MHLINFSMSHCFKIDNYRNQLNTLLHQIAINEGI